MGRKRQLKERVVKNQLLQEYQMKVTYRGVSYDTVEYQNRPQVTKKVTEVYRGINHTETVTVEVSK